NYILVHFFSRKLSEAERNYDIGNRELLAIKLALEEWRHWLEGAQHPFLVLTDHKNLQYLQTARRLKTRQARWALFFSWFNFTVTYRPGPKNIKADALSWLHDETQEVPEPDYILPRSCFVAPVQWDFTQDLAQAQQADPKPPGKPSGKQYVPPGLRTTLLQWAHDHPAAGHPGFGKTQARIQQLYWWPSLREDVQDYIRACPVCAQSKASNQSPAGLLEPQPVPNCPWMHLALDFLVDLPLSDGKTTILTVIDRFSKGCRLIPLPKLPSALETAELLFQHVFRLYGIPEDIVSDRGPQFTSHVWRAFWKKLGVTVSMTSGYHPQANGQVERLQQDIGRYLRSYCLEHPTRWVRYLPLAEYAHNTLTHTSTGVSPLQCILGYQPPLFPWQPRSSDVPAVDSWYRTSSEVWAAVRRHLQESQTRVKHQADRHWRHLS
uniref:Gypsy retrotransposon integrase-like protein 1 n=1 Tax=Scleropages formosus TaxID=113540 RepID=A0A8C9W0E0_SCLFO